MDRTYTFLDYHSDILQKHSLLHPFNIILIPIWNCYNIIN